MLGISRDILRVEPHHPLVYAQRHTPMQAWVWKLSEGGKKMTSENNSTSTMN